ARAAAAAIGPDSIRRPGVERAFCAGGRRETLTLFSEIGHSRSSHHGRPDDAATALNCTPPPRVPALRGRAAMRITILATSAFLCGMAAAGSGTLGAAWEPIARLITLQDPPRPASANVLSEHEIENLDEMSPQAQATLLLERSINHYQGANEQIAARVASWRGQVKLDDRLNNLFVTAINSDDLTVRIAGIEVDIAARDIEKSAATVDR